MPPALLALLIAVTAATANTAVFEIRAFDLQRRWQAAEAAGVPAASLAQARRQVDAQRTRWVGLMPYPAVSGALVSDPFPSAEASTDAAYRGAVAAARARAEAALGRLREAAGPNDGAAHYRRVVQLARAARPADLDALARTWSAEAARMAEVRRQLAAQAGGLNQGLPADVVAATAALSGLADRAAGAGIAPGPAGNAIADAQLYLGQPYPEQTAGHQPIVAELRAAADALQHRLDLRARAAELLASTGDLLDQAAQYGAGDDFKGPLAQVEAALAGARSSGDEARLDAALVDLQKLVDDLEAAREGRLPTAGVPCRADAPVQLIVIHLATQQLVAYDHGCPILRTPVTTGRPALPTGRGTFHVFYKARTYHMVSPWGRDSPFYYEPTWVDNAMEFIADGTFMHSADWQPAESYGPGSQYGPYASHGCIHVMDGPLKQLYDWTAIGATVVVGD